MTKEQLSLAWLTNLPAPYRKPIWNRLSSKFKLKVYSYLNEENYRGWGQPESKVWSHTFLNKKHIRTAENDLSFSPFGAKKILSNTDAVVVAGWETPIYISTLIRARKVGVPAINFYESTTSSHRFKGPLVRSIRRYIFNLADYIVTSGSASTEAVLATGIAREKIVELFNPVDVEYFAQFASTHRPAQGIGHKFLFVGQLIERKNLLAAIKAFASIANPEDSFTIAGKGPLQPQIEKLIAELKLQRQVHLVGHKSQEELAELYAISHTLVMPSTNEVWGLVANEALATGMHAITSDVAGVSEFIKEMKGAYICTSEQSSIATKMSQSRQDYLGPIKDPEILKFTPEKFADELEKIICTLVKQHWAKDLVWISNIATPYRNVLWLALAKQLDLSLVFMARSESDRLWNPPEELESTNLDLKSRNLSFISTPIYINWLPLYRLQLWQITPAVYIDGWESPAFYINAWILKRKGTKVIFGYRSTTSSHRFKGPLVRSIRRYIFNLADYIVTSGSASTEAVLATGIAREKIVELFNPVDVEYFAQFASTHRPAQGIGHKFLFVGQLIERKNLLAAIKAFASIANPEDSFTIAGKGPLQPQIEKLIAELKLQRQVHLVGHKSQEELAELYAISHTLVMPSTNEVWGLVANEALATGMHAITSDVAGVSEFIKEMKGAYICTSEQSSIATKMSQSRQDYLGPIKDPEILKFTPEKFADEFIANLLNKSIV